MDAGRTWATLAGWRFGPRERLKILDRAVAAGGVSPDILTTRRRIQLALEGPKGEESSLHQSSSAYVLSTATPEKAAKLGKLVEDQIRHLTETAAYSVQAREPATVLHFMSEVEADGFLGGLGLEKGTRGYLSELRLLVVVGDPAWSRFRPRVLGPLFPWYMETRYALRAIPAWVPGHISENGVPVYGAILAGLATHPWDLPGLIRLKRDSGRAVRSLRRVAGRLGPSFGFE